MPSSTSHRLVDPKGCLILGIPADTIYEPCCHCGNPDQRTRVDESGVDMINPPEEWRCYSEYWDFNRFQHYEDRTGAKMWSVPKLKETTTHGSWRSSWWVSIAQNMTALMASQRRGLSYTVSVVHIPSTNWTYQVIECDWDLLYYPMWRFWFHP